MGASLVRHEHEAEPCRARHLAHGSAPTRGFGLKLFAECLACGLLVGIGFLWGPLTIIAFATDGHAPWFWPTIGGVSLAAALLMFAYVRRDVKDFVGSLDES